MAGLFRKVWKICSPGVSENELAKMVWPMAKMVWSMDGQELG